MIRWYHRLAVAILLPFFVLGPMALIGVYRIANSRIADAELFCRDGEVQVYNLRQHRDPVFGWTPDEESQFQGAVPVLWCDSSGIPTTLTADERDAYGISLEKP